MLNPLIVIKSKFHVVLCLGRIILQKKTYYFILFYRFSVTYTKTSNLIIKINKKINTGLWLDHTINLINDINIIERNLQYWTILATNNRLICRWIISLARSMLWNLHLHLISIFTRSNLSILCKNYILILCYI